MDINIVYPDEQSEVTKKVCKKLWSHNFDDTELYAEYYFNNRWKESISLLADDVSMIHLNPYTVDAGSKTLTLHYIVGVCTEKNERRKGYMDRLLRRALKLLYDKKEPFTYLMPADEKIYLPYDFCGIYPVTPWSGNLQHINHIHLSDLPKDTLFGKNYKDLSESDKKLLIKFTNKKHEEQMSCYVVHDERYFDELYLEMLACNGSIEVYYRECDGKNECVGYIVYLCEERLEIAESVIEKSCIELVLSEFCQSMIFLEQRSAVPVDIQKVYFYETHFIDSVLKQYPEGYQKKQNYLMARIVDFKEFLNILPYKTEEIREYYVEIEDTIIKENSGKWHITVGKSGIAAQKEDIAEVCYKQYDIAKLGQILFEKFHYYMNELV